MLAAYKNGLTGFLGQTLGNTEISGFILADNSVSNLQIHQTNLTAEPVTISNLLLIGASFGGDVSRSGSSIGLITARTEGLVFDGVAICNYVGNMTVVQSCSQCENKQYTIVGGVTTTFSRVSTRNCTSAFIAWNVGSREVF